MDRVVWSGSRYAASTEHHRVHDSEVLKGIVLPPGGTLLDLGCGVGDLTERLADLVPDGRVIAVDADADMIDTARSHHAHPRVDYHIARAQDLSTIADASVDGAVSVAMLHWVPRNDHPSVLRELARVIRPGGCLRADLGGQGQIRQTIALLDEVSAGIAGPRGPWWFPSPPDYLSLLDAGGFDVSAGHVLLRRQRRRMPDLASLTGWLDSQVLIAYTPSMDERGAIALREGVLRRAESELKRPDGSYDQDYVRLDVLAHRRS